MNQKKISRAKEDYLKAVYVAIKKHGSCRNMDVSKYLGVSKSGTCIAIKKLEQDGFVVKDDWRILLTDKGQEIGCKLYEKDHFFADWFREIGVSEDIALKDACRIEHAISEETYVKIRNYVGIVYDSSIAEKVLMHWDEVMKSREEESNSCMKEEGCSE